MANGRLEKVEIINEEDNKTMIKREFFLSKTTFNEIVDSVISREDYPNFSAWVFDACRQKLKNLKGKNDESRINLNGSGRQAAQP